MTFKVNDPRVVVGAVQAGEVDALFRAIVDLATLPRDVRMIRAFDSPLELLVGPRHPLAAARTVEPSWQRSHRIWVPGTVARIEWAEFYDQLVTEFDLRIDPASPNFGNEVLLDALADSAGLATFSVRGIGIFGRSVTICDAFRLRILRLLIQSFFSFP
ncbi:hypothetical protein [Actinophytocola sediminis]